MSQQLPLDPPTGCKSGWKRDSLGTFTGCTCDGHEGNRRVHVVAILDENGSYADVDNKWYHLRYQHEDGVKCPTVPFELALEVSRHFVALMQRRREL